MSMKHAPQPHSPTIVIVGGVAGGASAAARARRTSEAAHIVLLEKDAHVSFANCGLPYYVGGEIEERDKLIVADAALLERRFHIDVRVRNEVLAIDRDRRLVRIRDHARELEYDLHYDKLILALGARPILPPLSGIGSANVFALRSLADSDRLHAFVRQESASRAVVVGGGFIGLEMAEQLVRRGLKVSLIEAQQQVLPPLDPEMAHLMFEALQRHGVDVHLGMPLSRLEVDGNRVVAAGLPDGTLVSTDLVLLGIGVRPNVELATAAGLKLGTTGRIAVDAELRTSDPAIYAVGDVAEYVHGVTGAASAVALAGPANRAGRLAGQIAAGGAVTYMGAVLGTAIVRVFERTAAITGLSLKAAQQAGLHAAGVLVEANNHAGYYPGAQSMVLKLVYDANNGRILGAQAVGGEGVDKRIDVIATAMHFGGTVEDLTELDLAYAPPFGSARDPVHVVGFAATNQRDGLVDFLPPDTDLKDYQVLDVRRRDEIASGLLPNAIHIPLDELRERLEELDAKKPTAVVCRSGLRAWLAVRILRQHGFERVSDVTGGMIMRAHARPHEKLLT
jgi:NADPH-dependent 2,4-dienoyl-CoA reductase/sulfur reductase-like enzyme/rhodanese-related sulfurtransferase